MKPPLVASLCIQLHGVSSKLRMANIMVLAAELEFLHKELNYHIKGVPLKADGGRKKMTWEAFCKTQAGLTDRTVRTYSEAWDALKFRLHYDPKSNSRTLLELMAHRPSTLEEGVRKAMIERIACEVITDHDTPTSLQKEFRQPRAIRSAARHLEFQDKLVSPTTNGEASGGSSTIESPDEMELLALACGVSKETARKVSLILKVRALKGITRPLRDTRPDQLN